MFFAQRIGTNIFQKKHEKCEELPQIIYKKFIISAHLFSHALPVITEWQNKIEVALLIFPLHVVIASLKFPNISVLADDLFLQILLTFSFHADAKLNIKFIHVFFNNLT